MPQERLGLYYPYVHFRDDEWLKKTLLVFPGLQRMVADDQLVFDSQLVAELAHGDKPLVRRADLHSGSASNAEFDLIALIREDLDRDRDGFLATYAQEGTLRSGNSFQMNIGKTSASLADFLHSTGLAWTPSHPDQQTYSELHPRLGRAALGMIAVACAKYEGLHIVAPAEDEPSRELNLCLASNDSKLPYKVLVRGEPLQDRGLAATADSILEVIVYCNCNVAGLDAQGLLELNDEREALRNLKTELQKIAETVPDIKNPATLEERLKDEASRVIKTWKQDRLNWSSLAKSVFAVDQIAEGATTEGLKLAITTFGPLGAAAALSSGALIDAAAGLGIGLVAHAVGTAMKTKAASKKSPFRYLTLAQKRGVAFSVAA